MRAGAISAAQSDPDCNLGGRVGALVSWIVAGATGTAAVALGGWRPPALGGDVPPEVRQAAEDWARCRQEALDYLNGSPRIGDGLKEARLALNEAKRLQIQNMIKFTLRAGLQVAGEVIDAAMAARLERLRALGAADDVRAAMQRARQLGMLNAKVESWARWVARARSGLQAAEGEAVRLSRLVMNLEEASALRNKLSRAGDLELDNQRAWQRTWDALTDAGEQAKTLVSQARQAGEQSVEAARQGTRAAVSAAQQQVRRLAGQFEDLYDARAALVRAGKQAEADALTAQMRALERQQETAQQALKAAEEPVTRAVRVAEEAVEQAMKQGEQLVAQATRAEREASRAWQQAQQAVQDAMQELQPLSHLNPNALPQVQEELNRARQAMDRARRELDAAEESLKGAQQEADLLRRQLDDGLAAAETARDVAGGVQAAHGSRVLGGTVGSDPLDNSVRHTTDAQGRPLGDVYALHGNYDDPAVIADGMQYVNDLKQRLKWLEGHVQAAMDCVKKNEAILKNYEAGLPKGNGRP